MSKYVPRTKAERGKFRNVVETPRGQAVTLTCGCQARALPIATKADGTDLFFCCGSLQRRVKKAA